MDTSFLLVIVLFVVFQEPLTLLLVHHHGCGLKNPPPPFCLLFIILVVVLKTFTPLSCLLFVILVVVYQECTSPFFLFIVCCLGHGFTKIHRPFHYSYIYSWFLKNSWAPHYCSSSCLSSLFWTSTPLRVNTIKGATMCVNIALNYNFISLKNHKGSAINWIVNFFSFLSSIPCKVLMFKTWFKLMSQKSFCKLGLHTTMHY